MLTNRADYHPTTSNWVYKSCVSHHFISEVQSNFKEFKDNLKDKCLVIGDFSENFTFCVQDEIQNYHWTFSIARLYCPDVIYQCPTYKIAITTDVVYSTLGEFNVECIHC